MFRNMISFASISVDRFPVIDTTISCGKGNVSFVILIGLEKRYLASRATQRQNLPF